MAEKSTETPQREQRLTRHEPSAFADPLAMIDRFTAEMDRVFDEFGFGRGWLSPRPARAAGTALGRPRGETWFPAVEAFQRNDELIVRAELPGLSKDDVSVEVSDDAITISGERKHEEQSEQGGLYRTERSYGSFHRSIPVPEGAIADQAKATFKNGVLEITMPAPPEHVSRGRRLEITEGGQTRK